MVARRLLPLFVGLLLPACESVGTVAKIAGRNVSHSFGSERKLPSKIKDPVRPDAGLAVLWVGHATVLVQMDDRLVMTDPVFSSTVGLVSRRLVEAGLDAADVPRLDAVVISHMHFDHLSLASLTMIEPRVGRLLVPEGASRYVPGYDFPVTEVPRWQTWEDRGMRITAVPVSHVGWRYGADNGWMDAFGGWVFEYRGRTVYFGGDTAYAPGHFHATRNRFPNIDLAFLPIAPLEPRGFMKRTHVDPGEALSAFVDLGARAMIPVHYDTFINSADEPGDALRDLLRVSAERKLDDRVVVLGIGEQRVLAARSP